MLANFLEKSKPITFVVLITLFLSFVILALFTNNSVDFYWENSLFSYGSYFFLLVSTFFFFNFIVVKNALTFDNALAFFFFIICLGLIPASYLDQKTLFTNLIILIFLRKVYSLQSSKKVIKKLFDGGFWLGILFITEPFCLIFVILLYVSIYMHQKITFQTLLIPIIAFGIPILLYFTYCFWYNDVSTFNDLFYWETPYDFSVFNSHKFTLPLLLIGVFLLFAILIKTPKALSVKNTFRKSWLLVLMHLITTIFLVLLVKEKNGSELIYLFFPLAVILANGLELVKNLLYKNLIITLFLIATITSYFL